MRDADAGAAVVPTLLVGAGAAVAIAAMRAHNEAVASEGPSASESSGSSTSSTAPVWIWPVPRWNGYEPTISSEYGTARIDGRGKPIKHAGVDVMFRRQNASDQRDHYPPRTKHGSSRFFMPDGIPVLAVRDGQVWSAAKTPRGYAVVLDHGPPWATFYQHLAEMFVRPTQRAQSAQRVRAGDVIGHVGADPLDGEGLMHLHFEMWYRGAGDSAINPEPLMKTWLIAPAPAPAPAPLVAVT